MTKQYGIRVGDSVRVTFEVDGKRVGFDFDAYNDFPNLEAGRIRVEVECLNPDFTKPQRFYPQGYEGSLSDYAFEYVLETYPNCKHLRIEFYPAEYK